MNCVTFFLLFLITILKFGNSHGFSKRKSSFQNRYSDFVPPDVPCELPAVTYRLPEEIREKILDIWKDHEQKKNCWIEMMKSRHILLSMSAKQRSEILKPTKECQVPSVVNALPTMVRRKISDIWTRNTLLKSQTKKECWEQQRKTRLLLLNLPEHLKNRFTPSPFDCALPHFFPRLEAELQEKLKDIWKSWKHGDQCLEQIDEQIKILEANDISLQSFQMPPAAWFKKREILRKLKRRENIA